jgi:flagellar FliL protein
MSTAAIADPVMEPAKPGGRRMLLLAIPVLLAGTGAALWFTGVLPSLLGMGHTTDAKAGVPAPDAVAVKAPTFLELPEMVANLNSAPSRRPSFVKLRARIELAGPQDTATAEAAMPRLLDLFQTYLREMRPDELRGSAGTWRLREELIARANIAIAPARVTDVLFTEMLIQ